MLSLRHFFSTELRICVMDVIRFISVTLPLFMFLHCSGISSVKYTNDAKLNMFIQELYLSLPDSQSSHYRVLNVSRGNNAVGEWVLSFGDTEGKEIASFKMTSADYGEKNTLLNISECNNSGVWGYAIVDWSVIEANMDKGVSPNGELTEFAYDLTNSPRIKSLVDSKYVYVSSSEGDDSNLGISSDKPVKTIAAAKTRQKDMKLRCGDVFFESVQLSNSSVSSYGNGAKPVVSGWKRLNGKNNKNVWQQGCFVNNEWVQRKGTNVWRLDMESLCFSGRTNLGKYGNNVGLIMNNETKEIYGHKCQFVSKNSQVKGTNPQEGSYLNRNFDFCQTSKRGNEGIVSLDFRYLYLYLDHDPGTLDLSFSTYPHGFSISNASVSNVRVEGFGCHGFSCGSDVKIMDCEIEYIGGSQQLGLPYWIRLGNGVEFYISKTKKNCIVSNNKISYVFDCATTIQGADYKDAWAENIVFEKNRISHCRQAFEHFLNNYDSRTGGMLDYVNCKFVKNVCINIGDNGFSSPEVRDACILSYEKVADKNIDISNNVFFGSNFYYGKNVSKRITQNKIYLYEDQYVYYPNNTMPEGKTSLRRKSTDSNDMVIMKRDSKQSKKLLDSLK